MCFDFADRLAYDDTGAPAKLWRRGTCVAGGEVLAMERGLLAAVDGAGGEVRLVLSCERTGAITESIEGTSAASVPAAREPCGVWVSLGAGQKR